MNNYLTQGKIKFTLNWEDNPKDLDLHAKFDVGEKSKCHVFFGRPYCLGVKLNKDVKEGGHSGAESIVVNELGNYKYIIFVGNFKSSFGPSSLQTSQAVVSMYSANFFEPIFSINIPNTSVGINGNEEENIEKVNWWLVLCYDGAIGMRSVKKVNKLLVKEPTLADCE